MDTKSKLDDFIQALYDAGWKAPCDAQWENIKVVYENFCTDLTQCQEVERLNTLLDEFWDMRTLPYESFKPELLNRLRAFSKEDKQ